MTRTSGTWALSHDVVCNHDDKNQTTGLCAHGITLAWVQFLWMSRQEYVFVVLLKPLIGSQQQAHSFSTQNLRTASQRFPARCCRPPCCCLSPWPTYSSQEKFWPTSDNCLCLPIQFWFPLHICLGGNWLWLPIRAQFWCSLESNLLGQMFFHLSAKCTHDKPLNL